MGSAPIWTAIHIPADRLAGHDGFGLSEHGIEPPDRDVRSAGGGTEPDVVRHQWNHCHRVPGEDRGGDLVAVDLHVWVGGSRDCRLHRHRPVRVVMAYGRCMWT